MPDLIDGRQLMARAQAGDIDAFGELYARYRDEVIRYAWYRHPDRAEEIAQDVFVKALANLHQWSDHGKAPGAWLRTITANLCRDRAKSADYRLTELVEAAPERAEWADRSDPGALVVEDLTRREVLRALLALTQQHREALILFYLRDLSCREVADQMGIPLASIRVVLHRARRELARLLAGVR